jgi:hypothetical protein
VFTLVTYKITFLLGKNTKEAIVIGTSEEECRFKLAMRYSQAAKPPLIEKMTLIESRECPVLQIGVDYMQELDRVWKEGLEFDANYGSALIEWMKQKRRLKKHRFGYHA